MKNSIFLIVLALLLIISGFLLLQKEKMKLDSKYTFSKSERDSTFRTQNLIINSVNCPDSITISNYFRFKAKTGIYSDRCESIIRNCITWQKK